MLNTATIRRTPGVAIWPSFFKSPGQSSWEGQGSNDLNVAPDEKQGNMI
jgi:hypothetical protein